MTVLTRSGLGAAVAAPCWRRSRVVVALRPSSSSIAGGRRRVGDRRRVVGAPRRRPCRVQRRVITVRVPAVIRSGCATGSSTRRSHRSAPRHDRRPLRRAVRSARRSGRSPTATSPTSARSCPPSRRGLFELGPADVVRTDPFGLAVGSVPLAERVPIVVHPRVHALTAATGWALHHARASRRSGGRPSTRCRASCRSASTCRATTRA